MTDEVMTQFNQEGRPAFPEANDGNENPSESSTENTNGDQTQSQEGKENSGGYENKGGAAKKEDDKNFADHPRWQEREADWKKRFNEQEERHTQEIAKLREEFAPLAKKSSTTTPTEIPAWFGGDEEQWAEYQKYESERLARVREETLKEFQDKSASEQKAIEEATKYMNEQVAALEADKEVNPSGQKVDKNKLLKFVFDNDLVDTKGRWNYRAGYIMMNGQATRTKTDTTKERKEIAGATTSERGGETRPPAVTTSADFSKPGSRPW